MRIALMGPAYSGKTTLAGALVERLGNAAVASYTDLLKQKAAEALTAIGLPTEVADIKLNKKFYRALLQDLGVVLGFDEGGFVEEAVASVGDVEHVIFDNVRFRAQWDKLEPLGFHLVALAITPMEQEVRAREAGLSADELGKVLRHPAELGFPLPEGTIVLPHEWTTEMQVAHVLEQVQRREERSRGQDAEVARGEPALGDSVEGAGPDDDRAAGAGRRAAGGSGKRAG